MDVPWRIVHMDAGPCYVKLTLANGVEISVCSNPCNSIAVGLSHLANPDVCVERESSNGVRLVYEPRES